jgi:hypothetical protein
MKPQKKSKKGVSVIVEYIFLVTFTIIIGVVVYQWMKTYVPQNDLNCPEGSSILIEDYSYDCTSRILTLTITNNGKFDIGGYFIYATDSLKGELATMDLSQNNTDEESKRSLPVIKFGGMESTNLLKPNEKEIEIYNLTGTKDIYSIEIIPIRWQVEKNREKPIGNSGSFFVILSIK